MFHLTSIEQYHRQHRRHRFFLAVAVAVIILTAAGIFLTFLQVTGAAAIIFSLSITNPESTEVIAEEPVEIKGAAHPFPLLAYASPPPENLDQPLPSSVPPAAVTLSVVTSAGEVPVGGTASAASGQASIPVLTENRPTFRGQTGVPRAFIFLEVHSDPTKVLTTSFNADEQGNWAWQPPRSLEAGLHVLYVTVFDPTGEAKLASVGLEFKIATGAGSAVVESPGGGDVAPPRTVVLLPPSGLDLREPLFDVQVKILDEGEAGIQPGENILAQISLLNIGSPGYLVETTVNYRLVDRQGTVLLDQSETIAVSTQVSFLKIFATKPTLAEGEYTLQVFVAYADAEAYSAVTVPIQGSAVISLPGEKLVNVSFIFQLLTILFLLAILVAYFEYKHIELIRKRIHQVTEDDFRREGLIS